MKRNRKVKVVSPSELATQIIEIIDNTEVDPEDDDFGTRLLAEVSLEVLLACDLPEDIVDDDDEDGLTEKISEFVQ